MKSRRRSSSDRKRSTWKLVSGLVTNRRRLPLVAQRDATNLQKQPFLGIHDVANNRFSPRNKEGMPTSSTASVTSDLGTRRYSDIDWFVALSAAGARRRREGSHFRRAMSGSWVTGRVLMAWQGLDHIAGMSKGEVPKYLNPANPQAQDRTIGWLDGRLV